MKTLGIWTGMNIAYNFDGDQNQSKNDVRPKCRENAKKKGNSCPDTQQKTKKELILSRAHKKTRKSHILGTYEKKM